MKPYYQDKWVTIYHGDCREILPQLDVKVDLVLTDPPYPNDKRFNGSWELINDTAFITFDMANDNTWLVSDIFRLDISRYILSWQPWDYVDLLIAYCANSMARCRFGFDKITTSIACQKGRAVIKSRWSNVISCNRITRKSSDWVDMTSPKYPDVYSKFIRMFSINENIVLDPFLGSGTTCYCAKKLNRYSIGIEVEEKYCEIAAKRCSQEVMELNI